MEGASKKRKICHDDPHVDEEADHDDDEEEKMEKFYALIKNIREARDRLMVHGSLEILKSKEAAAKESDDVENPREKRKLEQVEKQVAVWKPSFQREDFMEQAHHLLIKKPLPAVSFASASQSKEGNSGDPKQEVKEGLDLSLSL